MKEQDISITDNALPKNVFGYVWRFSKKEQIWLLVVTALSFPVLYLSLEVPKKIINDALGSMDGPNNILGIELSQHGFLIVLCIFFLVLIALSGAIKMHINVRKGNIAEKLVRRLRYQLIESSLKGKPKVSQGELIPIITAETAKLGGFFGDAIATPAFQGGTMLTILGFLMVQNIWLGLASIAMIPLQIYWIPKLQKRVNLLNRQTVRETRKLSNRIGDSITGIGTINSSGTVDYFLSNFSESLNALFQTRLNVHAKKNFVKFLNNFINQITPFLFFLIGGMLVLKNELTLGALVAGLSAYKDLTSPWKEVLGYYQATSETAEKYLQIIEPFNDPRQSESHSVCDFLPKPAPRDLSLTLVSAFENATLSELYDINLDMPSGSSVSVYGEAPDELDLLARIVCRTHPISKGSVRLGELDYCSVDHTAISSRIGYLDKDSHVFDFSINDNITLGLKLISPSPNNFSAEKMIWAKDARATGNFAIPPDVEWSAADLLSDSFEDEVFDFFELLEIDQSMFLRGLDAGFYPNTHEELENAIKELRPEIHRQIESANLSEMVFPFHPDSFNPYASLDENIIFGSPTSSDITIGDVIEHPFTDGVIEQCGLGEKIQQIGGEFAKSIHTLVEAHGTDDPMLSPFGFITPEFLEKLNSVNTKLSIDTRQLNKQDKSFLKRLAFRINPQRHGVDYFDTTTKDNVIQARKLFQADCPDDLRKNLQEFSQNEFNYGLSVQCNLLFGRIAFSKREARKTVQDLVARICKENNLVKPIALLAAERDAGIGGSNLPNDVREIIPVIRELIKIPDVFVLNRALRGLSAKKRQDIITRVRSRYPKMSILHIDDAPAGFRANMTLELVSGRLVNP